MANESILVSVCVVTYNHGAFLRQTLEGIIAQRVDFDLEVIVGVDLSSDNTLEIAMEYRNRFPDKIKVLKSDQNLGMNGNWGRTLAEATGDFIAVCEGDDYWIDPDKLQKQVRFCLSKPECSLVFHKTRRLEGQRLTDLRYPEIPEVIDIGDFIRRGSVLIHTSSILFRRSEFELIEPFYTAVVIDKYIILNTGARGKFGYLPEYMSVYRIHGNGIWSPHEQKNDYKVKYIEGYAELLAAFDRWTQGRYKAIIRRKIDWDAYSHLKKSIGNTDYSSTYKRFKLRLSLKSRLKLLYFRIIRM